MENINRYYDKLKNSTVACIGYALSPLSWWNDAYVNIPIAYFAAWLLSLINAKFFLAAFTLTYLATNLAGFILLHKGIAKTLSRENHKNIRYTRKSFLKDMIISLLYTGLMVVLVELKIIRPIQDYLK